VIELRYHSPLPYALLGLGLVPELSALQGHQWEFALFIPVGLFAVYAASCIVYQRDKEVIETKIRDLL
jgi:hypothetical protein